MQKRLVLHLGGHKTGTSVIQRYMRDRPEIMAKNMLGFTLRSELQKLLGWGDPNRIATNRLEIRAKIDKSFEKGCDNYFISSENAIGRPFKGKKRLYAKAEQSLRALAEAFKGYDVTVLYYIRKQSSFIESYYLQSVHEGGSTLFDDWMQDINVKHLSWAPVVNEIKEMFSENTPVIKCFEQEISKGQRRFLASAFEIIQPGSTAENFDNFDYDAKRNISVGKKGLEIALRINPIISTPEERKLVRNFLQWNFNNTKYARPNLFTTEQAHAIDESYSAENAQLISQ